jgi:hypothetical protein
MTGSGPYAWMIGRRFSATCERLGLNARKRSLSADAFALPLRRPQQLDLF